MDRNSGYATFGKWMAWIIGIAAVCAVIYGVGWIVYDSGQDNGRGLGYTLADAKEIQPLKTELEALKEASAKQAKELEAWKALGRGVALAPRFCQLVDGKSTGYDQYSTVNCSKSQLTALTPSSQRAYFAWQLSGNADTNSVVGIEWVKTDAR